VLDLELIGDCTERAKVFLNVLHRRNEVAVKRANDHFGVVVVDLRHFELLRVVVLLPIAMVAIAAVARLPVLRLPPALRRVLLIGGVVVLRVGVPVVAAVTAIVGAVAMSGAEMDSLLRSMAMRRLSVLVLMLMLVLMLRVSVLGIAVMLMDIALFL